MKWIVHIGNKKVHVVKMPQEGAVVTLWNHNKSFILKLFLNLYVCNHYTFTEHFDLNIQSFWDVIEVDFIWNSPT